MKVERFHIEYGEGVTWGPEHNLWAAVLETFIHDWIWCVVYGRPPLSNWYPQIREKSAQTEDYNENKRKEFVGVITSKIFDDIEEPGYLYWICQNIFNDNWEMQVDKIRVKILSFNRENISLSSFRFLDLLMKREAA